MRIKLVAVMCALSLVGFGSLAFAKDCGKVKSVDGTKVTIETKDGKAVTGEGSAKVGDEACIADGKVEAKKKKVEGC